MFVKLLFVVTPEPRSLTIRVSAALALAQVVFLRLLQRPVRDGCLERSGSRGHLPDLGVEIHEARLLHVRLHTSNICHRAGRIVDRQGSHLGVVINSSVNCRPNISRHGSRLETARKALKKRPTPSSPGYGWRCSCGVLPFRFRCTPDQQCGGAGRGRLLMGIPFWARSPSGWLISSPRRAQA